MIENNQKQYAAVWMDNHKAMIITNAAGSQNNEVKANEIHGGGSEHSINNARQSDIIKYFKRVSGLLLNYDEIFVFGPGKSQEQFQNHLKEDVQFNSKQITIGSAEQLTDPQMIARVRDFFRSRQS